MRTPLLGLLALALGSPLATAQIKLPSPSPGATLMQTVGTTDFTVKYSRPSLKGRSPFTAAFVPTGKVWRTGANQATTFTNSTDITIGGMNLPAGTYAILSVPATDNWTLIFSKKQDVTEQNYQQSDDALRVPINATKNNPVAQTFTIQFSDLTDSTANLNFCWNDVKATAPIRIDVAKYAAENVEKAVADKPDDANVLLAAANYNLSKGRNLTQALGWVDKAIALKETFRNLYVKSQLLAKMGNIAEALPLAQRALSVGQSSNDPAFGFFKDGIEKSITDLTAQLPTKPAVLKGKKAKKS